ncbi:MAG: hypothetical protein JW829_19020 [Pirellulales bacterium]|nr:hypothetical protein [Pirellulales bacterium]
MRFWTAPLIVLGGLIATSMPAAQPNILKNDRCETNNLADQETELVKQLGSEWIQYAKRVHLHPFDQ